MLETFLRNVYHPIINAGYDNLGYVTRKIASADTEQWIQISTT